MKTKALVSLWGMLCASAAMAGGTEQNPPTTAEYAVAGQTPKAISWKELGSGAVANCQNDGLMVRPSVEGARLHCVFQRLDGEATVEGLWLTSRVPDGANDRFRVRAASVGRLSNQARVGQVSGLPVQGADLQSGAGSGEIRRANCLPHTCLLGATGTVSVQGQAVQYSRLGLVEDYGVSMDGVRQDFVVELVSGEDEPRTLNKSNIKHQTSKIGDGELVVTLAVTGARVEAAPYGARLVLDHSGRKIAYSRLRVTDATGKELPARLEVQEKSEIGDQQSQLALAVVVEDSGAVYPVQIDPTFSDANWLSLGGFAGANGSLNAVAVDGSGNLYIGGQFNVVGSIYATNIAKWNGSSWSALGAGVNYQVNALAVSGTNLYAGGYFTTAGGIPANHIARWDGHQWSTLGSGMNDLVNALAISDNLLYAGGQFTNAGGIQANCIAQWNGTDWSALGSGLSGDYSYTPNVAAIAVAGNAVYVGGEFTTAGDVSNANYVAEWDGSSWSALGSGMGSPVTALAVSGATVYAGGQFFTAGGNYIYSLAQWNGANWSQLGSGLGYDANVLALTASSNILYVGGNGLFSTGGANPYGYVAAWNGSSWSVLGSNLNSLVTSLAVSGNRVYAGGWFSQVGICPADFVAQWNGQTWTPLGSSLSPGGVVYALAFLGNTVYAGGNFVAAGGDTNANYIAQWNGNRWSALGGGLNGEARSLAVSDGMLYVGGQFSTAGVTQAACVAQWNGSAWSALGSGMAGQGNENTGPFVYALAVSSNILFAAGTFSTAGGNPVNNIAQWNGSTWSALGSGLQGSTSPDPYNGPYVSALAPSGGTLYVGGYFTTAGGNPATNIAQWNGAGWSALGAGITGAGADGSGPYVSALAVSGSTLFAGGDFTNAGGVRANYIAQWNGSSWSTLGNGMSGADGIYGSGPGVYALAASGATLYVGGIFTTAGSAPATNIALWNGSAWSGFGSGVSGTGDGDGPFVSALALAGNSLYVGGDFTTAGATLSAFAAEALLAGPPLYLVLATNSLLNFSNGAFGFNLSGPAGCIVVIQASANLQSWTALQTNLLGAAPLYFSDPQSPTNHKRFYRAALLP